MTDACSATSSQAELCLDRGVGGLPTVASDPSVSLTLLGGFSCHVDGVRVTDTVWRLKKARDLVKVLALAESHTLHREQLMDVLWSDRNPTSAANNLNQAVHAARRVLGRNRLTLRDQVLRLDAVVDVDQFRIAADRAADKGTREAHRCALALYSGDLLPENRYDVWAQDHLDTLAAIRLSVHNGLASIKKHVRPDFPIETSSFIGRKRDIDELRESVRHGRLISIIGVRCRFHNGNSTEVDHQMIGRSPAVAATASGSSDATERERRPPGHARTDTHATPSPRTPPTPHSRPSRESENRTVR